jgi:hypothetical protein
MALTESQGLNLVNRGIYVGYHNTSLQKEYPFAYKWVTSKEGKKFLSGEKELLLLGGWDAVEIGSLMQKAFVLENGEGVVTDIWELADNLRNPDEVDPSFREHILNSSSIFISSFQEDTPCPMDTIAVYLVCDFMYERHLDPNFGQTIIQASEEGFKWYPRTFRDFIKDSFLTLEVECE